MFSVTCMRNFGTSLAFYINARTCVSGSDVTLYWYLSFQLISYVFDVILSMNMIHLSYIFCLNIILARKTCYKEWTLEYHGYLIAGHHNLVAGTTYTCFDSHSDTLHGGATEKGGKLFYLVEAHCGSLKCPSYVHGRELVCVACSNE